MSIVRAIRAAVASDQSNSLEVSDILVPGQLGSRLWLLLVALATLVFCVPYFRIIYRMGDEGVLLHGADLLLQGSKLYADFFEFLPPGGFLLTAAWFSLTGISFASARILAILTIVAIACLTYLACRRASGNAPLSALLAILWVAVSPGVSHHWFTTLLSMIGFWAALASVQTRRSLRWPIIAGVAAGAAGMVTPTRGVLAVLAALTAFLGLRRKLSESVVYVLAVALVPVVIIAYLAVNGSLYAAFDDVILFTATRYSGIHGVPFGHEAELGLVTLLSLFPIAALLTLLVCARDWRSCVRDRVLRVCAAFGLAGFIGCFPHPNIGHIAYAAPLVCPLLAYCMSSLTRRSRHAFRYVFAAATVCLCIITAMTSLRRIQAALEGEVTSTQRGGIVVFTPAGAGEMLKRIDTTPRDDAYFFYPYMPLMPFLAARKHTAKYDLFIPEYTLPSQYRDACLSVMRDADWLVVDRTWIGPQKWKEEWPAMTNPQPPETLEFERALDRGFEFVARDATFELHRRRKDVGDDICAGLVK